MFETVRIHFLIDVFGLLSSRDFNTMTTWCNDFFSLHSSERPVSVEGMAVKKNRWDHTVNPSLSPLATHCQFSDLAFLHFIFSLLIPETTEVHEQIWKTEEKVRWKEKAPQPRITKSGWYQYRGTKNGALMSLTSTFLYWVLGMACN